VGHWLVAAVADVVITPAVAGRERERRGAWAGCLTRRWLVALKISGCKSMVSWRGAENVKERPVVNAMLMPYRRSALKAAALAAPRLVSGSGVAPSASRMEARLYLAVEPFASQPKRSISNSMLFGEVAHGAAAEADEVEELGHGDVEGWRSIRLLQINS